jgi:hypothetical protein
LGRLQYEWRIVLEQDLPSAMTVESAVVKPFAREPTKHLDLVGRIVVWYVAPCCGSLKHLKSLVAYSLPRRVREPVKMMVRDEAAVDFVFAVAVAVEQAQTRRKS